jgi:hypothetical protein
MFHDFLSSRHVSAYPVATAPGSDLGAQISSLCFLSLSSTKSAVRLELNLHWTPGECDGAFCHPWHNADFDLSGRWRKHARALSQG